MTNEEWIELCLKRLSMGKTSDVMNFSYADTLAYIERLKAENAALRERRGKAVELPCEVADDMSELNTYKILDATCGGRSIWFNKHNPNCLYIDKRIENHTKIWETSTGKKRFIDVHPDIVADFTDLPFPDSSFYLVVFDPPHLLHVGENAWLKKKYGKLPSDWRPLIHDGFRECMRVLKPNGTLIFKWNETDIPVRDIIKVCGVDPLFGHKSGKMSKTHWLCFMKPEVRLAELQGEVNG